jgi:hypothetical protein
VSSALRAVAAGTCTLIASQSGNSNYLAATSVTRTVAIGSGIPQNISIVSTKLHPGGSTQLTASGYKPGSQLVIEIRSEPIVLETVTVTETGTVTIDIQIPSGLEPGNHTLVLIGIDSSNAAKTQSIPISVITTAGLTVPFTGRVTTKSGQGVPELFITATKLDGSGSANGRSDSSGNFNVNIPTGVSKIQIWWTEWSDSQIYARNLRIPASWSYTVNSIDVSQAINWNLVLPDTRTVTVSIDNNALAGYVTMQSTPSGVNAGLDPLSSTFEISPGISGQLRQGTISGRYTVVGTPAVYDIFPVANFARISVTTSMYSGNGFGFMPGVSNLNLSETATVLIPYDFVPLTLNVNSGGRTVNSGPLSIIANDSSFDSNGSASDGTYLVPRNVPFRFTLFGAQSRSGGSVGVPNGPFPPSWSLKSETITATSALTINLTLPETIDINVSSTYPISSGTGLFMVSDTASRAISVPYTGGTAELKNGPSESQQTGGHFYLFNNGTNLETVTVLVQGQVAISTGSGSRNVNSRSTTSLNLSGVPASSSQSVSVDLSISDEFRLTILNNAGTPVGITSFAGSNSTTGGMTFGDSDANGLITALANTGVDKISVSGSTNISSSLGLPPFWYLQIDGGCLLNCPNYGVFRLPQVQTVRIKLLDAFGLPISGAQVSEILSMNVSDSATVTSDLGIVGHLYNGGCNTSFGCVKPWNGFNPAATFNTDANGFVDLIRFNTGPIGQLYLNLPGQGSNQPQTGLIVSGTQIVSNTLTLPDRR